MKIRVRNLGVLKNAEFELGDLTVLCGENNTGKTYATYALYGFLTTWRRMLKAPVSSDSIASVTDKGTAEICVKRQVKEIDSILRNGCAAYTKELPRIFASSADKFNGAKFSVLVDKKNISLPDEFNEEVRIGESVRLRFSKSRGDEITKISLTGTDDETGIPPSLIRLIISDVAIKTLFDSVFPKPFIASAERTGAAIFRKELDFARNRLLEKMSAEKSEKKTDLAELLYSAYEDYPLPVTHNVDFTRKIEDIARKSSFLAEEHPDVLDDFADIIGGGYVAHKNQGVSYRPRGRKPVTLNMGESSSAVRSLLDVGFYLRHIAQRGHLLMIDEPELNLHPENQRQIARLFARLVALGMKVFITTHSDYIIKEFNALIMLNQDKPHLKKIAKRENIKNEELLSFEKVKVYVAKKDLIRLEGNKRRSRHHTLVRANITQEEGIEVSTFDETINKMNEIEEAILWGENI